MYPLLCAMQCAVFGFFLPRPRMLSNIFFLGRACCLFFFPRPRAPCDHFWCVVCVCGCLDVGVWFRLRPVRLSSQWWPTTGARGPLWGPRVGKLAFAHGPHTGPVVNVT